MLADFPAMATLPTADMARARAFYEGLGFPVVTEGGDGVVYRAGAAQFLVFPTPNAGTNKATALTFTVDDINGEVRTLKDKGISFEHYDVEGLKSEGDIYSGENMKTAWFKDPDGNILSLFEGEMA